MVLRATLVARDTAVAQYEKSIQIAFREVADALAARGYLDEQLAAQQALVSASQGAYQLAQMRFRGGVDNYLQVITAQTVLLTNQRNDIDIQRRRMDASVLLVKAVGGGWNASQLPKF